MADPLILTKRDDGVAIISTNDDPLNRMTLDYVAMFGEVVDDIAADRSIRAFVAILFFEQKPKQPCLKRIVC